jgi:hypothetical protein
MNNFFDRIRCINLDRRPERWATLNLEFRVLEKLQRFPAADGLANPPPAWWRELPGAWGNFCSHRAVLADFLASGANSLLVLEDDCQAEPNFVGEIDSFLSAVPANWDQLYFGGVVMGKTEPVNALVRRAFGVQLAHAYGIRRAFAEHLVKTFSTDQVPPTVAGCFVSHFMAAQHADRRWNIYTPERWLIRQKKGPSDVIGMMTRWKSQYFEGKFDHGQGCKIAPVAGT